MSTCLSLSEDQALKEQIIVEIVCVVIYTYKCMYFFPSSFYIYLNLDLVLLASIDFLIQFFFPALISGIMRCTLTCDIVHLFLTSLGIPLPSADKLGEYFPSLLSSPLDADEITPDNRQLKPCHNESLGEREAKETLVKYHFNISILCKIKLEHFSTFGINKLGFPSIYSGL